MRVAPTVKLLLNLLTAKLLTLLLRLILVFDLWTLKMQLIGCSCDQAAVVSEASAPRTGCILISAARPIKYMRAPHRCGAEQSFRRSTIHCKETSLEQTTVHPTQNVLVFFFFYVEFPKFSWHVGEVNICEKEGDHVVRLWGELLYKLHTEPAGKSVCLFHQNLTTNLPRKARLRHLTFVIWSLVYDIQLMQRLSVSDVFKPKSVSWKIWS